MNLSRLRNLLAVPAVALTLASCSMMEEDLAGCPDGLDIHFKYDYNTQRADMFADHVGAVTVYVFDENNRFVTQRSAANAAGANPLKAHDFAIHFGSNELAPGRYRLLALAGQKEYGEMLAASGAKFRRTELQPGDDITRLQVRLDRGEAAGDEPAPVENELVPLDTLWHGMNDHLVELRPDRTVDGVIAAVKDTISLTRDTKQLNITLRQTVDDGDIRVEDYDVRIIDKNGLLLYDNTPDEADGRLLYTPYAAWQTDADDGHAPAAPGTAGLQAAHYELFTSRLMHHGDDTGSDARLVITNRVNGEKVVDIDLPYYLAADRDAFSTHRYTPQEFLDREYRYNMSFFLVGGRWQYMILSVGILDYYVRYQNVDL